MLKKQSIIRLDLTCHTFGEFKPEQLNFNPMKMVRTQIINQHWKENLELLLHLREKVDKEGVFVESTIQQENS